MLYFYATETHVIFDWYSNGQVLIWSGTQMSGTQMVRYSNGRYSNEQVLK